MVLVFGGVAMIFPQYNLDFRANAPFFMNYSPVIKISGLCPSNRIDIYKNERLI
jgi:hypothetical protein